MIRYGKHALRGRKSNLWWLAFTRGLYRQKAIPRNRIKAFVLTLRRMERAYQKRHKRAKPR